MSCKMLTSQRQMVSGMGGSTFGMQTRELLTHYESNGSLLSSRLASMIDRAQSNACGVQATETTLTIEDLRRQFNSCSSCGVSWSDNHVSLDCKECGGYSLTRPCPICEGKCTMQWTRDVSISHEARKAKWEGSCAISDKSSLRHNYEKLMKNSLNL